MKSLLKNKLLVSRLALHFCKKEDAFYVLLFVSFKVLPLVEGGGDG